MRAGCARQYSRTLLALVRILARSARRGEARVATRCYAARERKVLSLVGWLVQTSIFDPHQDPGPQAPEIQDSIVFQLLLAAVAQKQKPAKQTQRAT